MVSPRQSKKFQKFFKKNILSKNEMLMKEKLKEILKPKPKFMPWWLWKFLIKKFLNLE